MLLDTRRILPAALLAMALLAPGVAAQGERVPPADPGAPFPAGTFDNLNPAAGGARYDLGQVIGKKPVVFCYWIADHERSEQTLLELQQLVAKQGAGQLELLGVVTERPGREASQIIERVKQLGLKVPVLNDKGFVLGQRLVVQTVPNIAILDAEGKLKLGNGAALAQSVEYKLNLGDVVSRAARTGQVGMYGQLAKYYPVEELVGTKCPDFQAPDVTDGVVRRWYGMFDPKQVNVIVFWSVDCPHCKKTMPQINEWLKNNPGGINLVSAANVSDTAMKAKTKEFCRYYNFRFPTLIDENRKLAEMFNVTATPTILFIRPDGVIDSVLVTGDFSQAFEAKRKELL